MKIYITPTDIGKKCIDWVSETCELVDDPNESDVFFSVFSNKLLTKEFLQGRRCYNFHGGILPDYRGSGTLNFAILNGEKEAGITLHEIDERIDHGDIIDIQRFSVGERDTTDDLYKKSHEAIFDLFRKWFSGIVQGTYPKTSPEGNGTLYTRAGLQKEKDLTRFARAFQTEGYENAYYFNSKGEKIYLKW